MAHSIHRFLIGFVSIFVVVVAAPDVDESERGTPRVAVHVTDVLAIVTAFIVPVVANLQSACLFNE